MENFPHVLALGSGAEILIYTVLATLFQILGSFFGAKAGTKKSEDGK